MGDSTRSSRIEEARRRSAGAKRKLGVAAVASFLVALVLGYVSHPGSTGASVTSNVGGSGGDGETQPDSDFDFGTGFIAPSGGGVPSAGTHVS